MTGLLLMDGRRRQRVKIRMGSTDNGETQKIKTNGDVGTVKEESTVNRGGRIGTILVFQKYI
jgi:hypothetical protein